LRAADESGAAAIISSLSSLSDAQILTLGRALDSTTATALAGVLSGSDSASAFNLLRTLAALPDAGKVDDMITAVARLQVIDPWSATRLLAQQSKLQALYALVRIGSPALTDMVLTSTDVLAGISAVANAMRAADSAGIDSLKFFAALAKADPRIVLDIANSPR